MKTFEESVKLLANNGSPTRDALARHASIRREAVANRDVHLLVARLIMEIANGRPLEEVLWTSFITGVTIGIEMERQELNEKSF